MEDEMSSAVEFLARNPATNPDTAPPAYDLAAFEKRLGNLERTSQLERRVAELERQNAKTQELASGLLALLWVPAALVAFSPLHSRIGCSQPGTSPISCNLRANRSEHSRRRGSIPPSSCSNAGGRSRSPRHRRTPSRDRLSHHRPARCSPTAHCHRASAPEWRAD